VSTLSVLAFCSGDERYLVRLEAVRAVVRLRGLRRLPGSSGALVGILDVQSTPVAIYDARLTDDPLHGDVMVLAAGWPDHAVGVACDRVDGLLELPEDALGAPELNAPRPPSLPSYVEALLRVDDDLVPLVDVIGLAEAGSDLT
jgi:chemotaxis signal transduction protein